MPWLRKARCLGLAQPCLTRQAETCLREFQTAKFAEAWHPIVSEVELLNAAKQPGVALLVGADQLVAASDKRAH